MADFILDTVFGPGIHLNYHEYIIMHPSLRKRINLRFPGAYNDAKQTRRRMMDERFCPEVFYTYRINRNEAISLLAPHYKLAHRMPDKVLEQKLNCRTRQLMATTNVWCFCRFLVVDTSHEVKGPVRQDRAVEVIKTVDQAEPPYEMMREQEDWFYQFRGKF